MIVRTVLGDVDPASLGRTYAHEHLILDSPLVEDRFAEIHLPDVGAAVAELGLCAAAGLGTVVDAIPAGTGRDAIRLAEVASRSGVNVIATTGLHSERWYPGLSWANEAPVETLADLFAADVIEGIDRFDYRGPVIDRTAHRAGVIKAATMTEHPTPRDRRLFQAAAGAHLRTGAPILTHCENGQGAMAQIDMLEAAGVPLDRVVLSHTDKVADPAYHRDLLEAGVYLEYDQALRQPADAPRGTAWLLTEMVEAGYAGRLMLGTDGARRSMWASLGGAPGLAWLLTGFLDVVAARGVDEATITTLLVANPARFFTFEPPTQP